MEIFDKNSPEYVSNGYYRYRGEEFMSIWAFKKRYLGATENTNSINGSEGKQLIADGIPYHKSKPDFGNFEDIFIYPVNTLKLFYNL